MSVAIQGVGIPRSGHHFLERLLRSYFNGGGKRRMHYCEYYRCCRTRPCKNFDPDSAADALGMHKSHDEILRGGDPDYEPVLVPSGDPKHLIQVRHPVPSTISDYERYLAMKPASDAAALAEDPNFETQSPRTWEAFSVPEVLYRKTFLEKWILDNEWIDSPRHLVLIYDDLVAEPRKQLAAVVRFVFPEEEPDSEALDRAMKDEPVKPKRDPGVFGHAESLDELHTLCDETWEACMARLGAST
jgi:hypothetical protein